MAGPWRRTFRKAGIKLSAKGQQVKEARRYKEDVVAQADQESIMPSRMECDAGKPAAGADRGETGSEAVITRLLAAHTSEAMAAIQGIHTKLNQQKAALEAQQEVQAELDRKLQSMMNP